MKKLLAKKNTLAYRLIGSVVLLLLVFSIVVGLIGYINFTKGFEIAYRDNAYSVAKTARKLVDGDRITAYLAQGNTTEEYKTVKSRMDLLCENMDVTLIYVIKVDTSDYGRYVNVFNSVHPDALEEYEPWECGYERETTNEEYRQIYRNLYDKDYKKDSETLYRTRNLRGHQPHITCLVPVKDAAGKTQAILCVQQPMSYLTSARMRYNLYIAVAMLLTMILVVYFANDRISKSVISPVIKIKDEAKRFAEQNTANEEKTLHKVSKIDEISSLAASINTMEQDTLKYIENLTAITSERERIVTELGVAADIQSGLVPHFSKGYPEREEFDLCASMTPAKEVGGDFYDYFLMDDDHLALVMADVSGKGIPAALFMMVTKILIKEKSKISGGTPAQILEFVNGRLTSNNPADMFVTVWLGILELSTGKLIAANAGHDNPAVYHAGEYRLLENKHELVLGAMDGIPYQDYTFTLEKGDKLFLYTDGVPEATNADDRLFTLERMLQSLNAAAGCTAEQTLAAVKADVDSFVGEAPQFDDLTMLSLVYHGTQSAAQEETQTLRVEALPEKLDDVLAFTDAFLEKNGCSPRAQMHIDLSVEEIFVNIAHYAYAEGTGDAEIIVSGNSEEVTIVFKDSGVPYDPLAKEDPDTTLSADERQIGGLGIFLVKKNMDHVSYQYADGKNILTIQKKLQ